ncbi:MAG: transposase [Parvularculaceae bacterium]
MPNYRRLFVPGGTYFFTVNLLDRSSDLPTRHIGLLRNAYRYVVARRPFETIAIVILPDHLHCAWRLPPEDHDFPTRWRLFKERFTKGLPADAETRRGRRKGERGVWQRRFWEHAIRNDEDLSRHVDYIHFNPVKHRYVADPDDWPYSTWHEWKREFGRPVNTPPEDWKPVHLGEA